MPKKIKVLILLSGGVDSSVAAALLKKRGFDLTAVFMILGEYGLGSDLNGDKCCSIEAKEAARRVASKLKIPFYAMNLSREFQKKVISYFLSEYKKGRTPNPCVFCNKFIKFGVILEKALSLGFDYVASGHYVRKIKMQNAKCKMTNQNVKFFRLLKARDVHKDQSYFLYTLNQKKLADLLFPLGDYSKERVRKMARKFDLPTAERRESKGVCFIKEKNIVDYLRKQIKAKSGEIFDLNSKKLIGKHRGLPFYTIGQRTGIGVGGTGPYYVVHLDFPKNRLWVTSDSEDPQLYRQDFWVSDVHWVQGIAWPFPLDCQVKIRYGHPARKAQIQENKLGKLQVCFITAQRAITPGQAAVFYREKEVLGGGIIEKAQDSQQVKLML